MITNSAKETGQRKEQWGWGLVVTENWGGTKCEKGGKKYMRRLRKIEGLVLLLQLCKETLKITNLPIIKLIHPFQASSNF